MADIDLQRILEKLKSELARAEQRVRREQAKADDLRIRVDALNIVLGKVLPEEAEDAANAADTDIIDAESAIAESSYAMASTPLVNTGESAPSLADAVRQTVRELGDRQFGIQNVRESLQEKWPTLTFNEASIGGAISRLVAQGRLRIVTPKRGPIAGTYRLVDETARPRLAQ